MDFDPAKLLVVSGYTPDLSSFAEMASENHREYCASRGYRYRCHHSGFYGGRSPSWSKVLFLLMALSEKDEQGRNAWHWVFWIDIDAIFTNFTIPLESRLAGLAPRQEMVLGEDGWGINTGLWFVKNTSWSHECLTATWHGDPLPFLFSGLKPPVWIEQDRYMAEQTTLWHHLALRDEIARIKLVPYYELGGYLEEYDNDANIPRDQAFRPPTVNAPLPRQSWRRGDFALHLAGVSNEQRARVFTRISQDPHAIVRS